ncbi:hypothetical protein PoB_001474600 [Plakobranchus ocellatus]|uniref:Uncharacterized protein n=1 Tax=Plakobranchus ocellatus TaxID=259542 RepID=A0AAV3Z0Y6_9GAST|nr:hypothetical protein PoB_001474600 [Plakobranchus ocellatus]
MLVLSTTRSSQAFRLSFRPKSRLHGSKKKKKTSRRSRRRGERKEDEEEENGKRGEEEEFHFYAKENLKKRKADNHGCTYQAEPPGISLGRLMTSWLLFSYIAITSMISRQCSLQSCRSHSTGMGSDDYDVLDDGEDNAQEYDADEDNNSHDEGGKVKA